MCRRIWKLAELICRVVARITSENDESKVSQKEKNKISYINTYI